MWAETFWAVFAGLPAVVLTLLVAVIHLLRSNRRVADLERRIAELEQRHAKRIAELQREYAQRCVDPPECRIETGTVRGGRLAPAMTAKLGEPQVGTGDKRLMPSSIRSNGPRETASGAAGRYPSELCGLTVRKIMSREQMKRIMADGKIVDGHPVSAPCRHAGKQYEGTQLS